jgi:hypothetical protein
MGDPWADEGFGGDDDWEAEESLESDLEDELDPLDLGEEQDESAPELGADPLEPEE